LTIYNDNANQLLNQSPLAEELKEIFDKEIVFADDLLTLEIDDT